MLQALANTLFLAAAAPAGEEDVDSQAEKFAQIQTWIEHHLADSQAWHLPGLHINLPGWISLHAVMLIVASIFLIILFVGLYDRKARIPHGLTNLLEVFIVFIRDDIAIPAMGEEDGKKMTPLFCSFFFFILTLNLMGLVPLFVTATANYSMTAAISTITMAVMIGGALIKNGPKDLLHAFMPSGVPTALLILLTPLEMIGVLVKIFALTIRLFANLFAGHVVVFTLVGMTVAFGAAGIPAIGMAVFISMIEILVAFLQAYIFTLLSAVFIGQVHHPAH